MEKKMYSMMEIRPDYQNNKMSVQCEIGLGEISIATLIEI